MNKKTGRAEAPPCKNPSGRFIPGSVFFLSGALAGLRLRLCLGTSFFGSLFLSGLLFGGSGLLLGIGFPGRLVLSGLFLGGCLTSGFSPG